MVSIIRNKSLLSIARRFSTSSSARQQAREEEVRDGEIFRPATSQMGKMTDIGGRSIFNADHDMFRENARKFFRDQLAPQHKRYEAQGHVDRQTWKVGPQN